MSTARTRVRALSGADHRRSLRRTVTVLAAAIATTAGLTVAGVISGPAAVASQADGSPIGELGGTSIVPGGLFAHGWDADPNAPKQPLWTFAKVDGKIVNRTKSDLDRPFLAKDHPRAGTAHGFGWMIPVP
ncbi:MAG TPA: hypothetical protein VFH38_10075, partial [Jatrophihabitans sp.]|nr:hypothetical protein [Jatrophihabitans sp.]